MFEKSHIEKFLRINGVPPDAPDDVIKSVLISAQWHEEDVEAAVLVLRENPKSHETRVDSLHKVFRSDDRLRPETISSLLGIEMDLTSKDIDIRRKRSRQTLRPKQMVQMALISLILSLIFVFAAMWYLKTGLFHQTLHY
jgi:hypothetical protein